MKSPKYYQTIKILSGSQRLRIIIIFTSGSTFTVKYVVLHYRFSYISTGKFDTRGRPIPGLAKLPQVQNKSKQPFSVRTMLPQGAGFTQSLSILKNSNAHSDGPGKIYVGGMPPSLSEPHLHVYFSQFGIVKNVTIIRDHETGERD